MNRFLNNQNGITLIEMMVVIVLIGILSSVMYVRLSDIPEKGRRKAALADIEAIGLALETYKLDNGFYPTTEQGLEALITAPTSAPVPRTYPSFGYLRKLNLDPWGNPYVYTYPGNNWEFDLESYGADGQDGGEGKNEDIENWNM